MPLFNKVDWARPNSKSNSLFPPADSNRSQPTRFVLTILFLAAAFLVPSLVSAQIENGGFESSTTGWNAWGASQLKYSTDSYEGGGACRVRKRQEYWQGLFQSLLGDLEAGKDYHFTCYIKLVNASDRRVRLAINQVDGRGTRTFSIGDVIASGSEWTLLQGGFQLQTSGELTELNLIVSGSDFDDVGGNFSFLVDSVAVAENDWRTAADQRIELHRKRDVELGFVDSSGEPIGELEVDVQQIRHEFGFGSALNDAFMTNPIYADFFKQNFEHATIEWFAQWPVTEVNRGIEDYTIADQTIDFAKSNGIPIKGHALAYPSTVFLPPWLQVLPPEEVQAELDERVTNIASRYKSELFGWDVSNEILNDDWLAATLGESVHLSMFLKAREVDPDVTLFTNEFGTENSEVKAKRYRQLVQGLVAGGADLGTIGLQSHFFEGFVSPKGIEIALSELDDLGIDLWFTEFDVVHPDPSERAKGLEDFYRYAFSRPEAKGITMWGFWAGTHWLGPDAAIVDSDWTINAAGQKYFDLIDEWTTSLSQSVVAGESVAFRGFHGDYLVSTVDPVTAATNYHLIKVPAEETLLAQTLLSHTLQSNPTDGSLTIYGTSGDDLFEFDFQFPDRVTVNGDVVLINLGQPPTLIRFVGGEGVDRLEMKSKEANQHFRITDKRLEVVGGSLPIEYSEIESTHAFAKRLGSTVTFFDSEGDDSFSSYHEISTLTTPEVKLEAENFRYVFCRKTKGGDDSAWLYDTPGVDRLYVDSTTISMRWGARNRRVFGFQDNYVYSTNGADIATFDLPAAGNTIAVSPTSVSLQNADRSIETSDFARVTFNGAEGNSDSVAFVGDDSSETLRVYEDLLHYSSAGSFAVIKGINQSSYAFESGGSDRVVINDTAGDDVLEVTASVARFTGTASSHELTKFNSIRAVSQAGGNDTAIVTGASPAVTLVGDWQPSPVE